MKSPQAHPEPPSTTQITTKPSPTTKNFRSDSQKKKKNPTNLDQKSELVSVRGWERWVAFVFGSNWHLGHEPEKRTGGGADNSGADDEWCQQRWSL